MRTLPGSLLVMVVACGGGGDSTPDAHTFRDAPVVHIDAPTATDGPGADGPAVDGPAVDGPALDAVGVDGAPLTPSQQIAAVRAATDGAVNLAVMTVLVTYVAPAVGNDPAGVFVQADQMGPALFLAVDPTTLGSGATVGQNVSFLVTMKATQDGQPRATAITGWMVNSTGNALTGLVQDLGAATDVVTALDAYDSELVTLTGTINGAFASSSTAHVAAELDTAGVTGNPALKLRLPTTVRAALDIASACVVKVGPTPLWRFTTSAEPSGWVAVDVTVMSCPAPKLTLAAATAATSVVVTFDRLIDPASVNANGSQFSFDMGLTATAATVSGNTVTVTTGAQTSVPYTLTVAATVKDTYGKPVDSTANSMMFVGFSTPAVLLINEVNPNLTGSKDLVELLAVSGGTINNIKLQQDVATPVTLATLPNLTVATGDLIVVHLNPAITTTAETTTKGDCTDAACYAGAWDVNGGTTGITFSNRVLRLVAPDGSVVDALALAKPAVASPVGYPADLQAIQAAGQWLPASCGGVPCTYMTTPSAGDATISIDWTTAATTATGVSVQRKSGQATKSAADWTAVTQTFGAANN